jgi:hypothetical protein
MGRRPVIAIVPYENEHYARLPVRPEQRGDLAAMCQAAGRAAELGPAFSAVELDDEGKVATVLACAGLAETRPPSDESGGYATAWAAFAEGLRPAQWSALTAAIRGVIEGADYARIDMMVRADFDAGRRYAEALGFTLDKMIFARRGGAALVEV